MNKPSSHKDNPFIGISFAVTAFGLFALMNAAAKLVYGDHTIWEIAFYRSLICLIPTAIWIALSKNKRLYLTTNRPITLFFRVVVGIFGLALTFFAVSKLPMANATLVFMSAVLITPAFAHIFLGEKSGLHRWLAIIMGLIGVILILEPSGEGEVYGYILAFGAAITHASAQIFLRALKKENSYMITFYFFLGGTIIMAPFVIMEFNPITWDTAPYLLAVGITGGLAQICLTKGMSLAPAPLIAPFNYSGLLFASLLDIIIWGLIPGFNILYGALIIIAAQSYIIYREKHAKQPPS